MPEIPDKLFFKIKEVSKITDVKPHILRYWESEFKVLQPTKNSSGQRIYKRSDIQLILEIKKLLYEEMFTIAGARKRISIHQKRREVFSEATLIKDDVGLTITQIKTELYEILNLLKKGQRLPKLAAGQKNSA